MARLLSSLISYFTDLWRRCFGKEYLVKVALGESTAKHDFRKCSECNHPVSSLDPFLEKEPCKNCKAILHQKGVYINHKGKSFLLRRRLYSKYFACLQIALLLCFAIGVGIIQIVPVPEGYFNEKCSSYLSAVFFAAPIQFLLNWFFLATRKIEGKWHSDIFSAGVLLLAFAAAALICMLSMEQVKGYSAVPFWIKIPSQLEIYERQKAELEKIPFSAERFSSVKKFASNPKVDLSAELLLAAEKDLVAMMQKHQEAFGRFSFDSEEERRFYVIYKNYLAMLKNSDRNLDQDEWRKHCDHDPWNMTNGRTMLRYPETWDICK